MLNLHFNVEYLGSKESEGKRMALMIWFVPQIPNPKENRKINYKQEVIHVFCVISHSALILTEIYYFRLNETDVVYWKVKRMEITLQLYPLIW